MRDEVKRAVERAVGQPLTSVRPVGGGDINEAYAVRLRGGRALFVKTNRSADPRMFACEARGLAWLAEANAIRVPEVVAVSGEADAGPHFLVLEMIAPGRRRPDFDELFGRALAALHASGADCFGLDHDNFIATLAQANTACDEWSEFYARRRLEPMLRLAIDAGKAPRSWTGKFERLLSRMEEIAGPREPPARLHGDLWSGNLHTDADGRPCLIDPAVYGGHREIDLAMLELFGNPGRRFFSAYADTYPLAPGRGERVPLYQLYPLLVHVNLFGGAYAGGVESALARYIA